MARRPSGLILPRCVSQFLTAVNAGDPSGTLQPFAMDAIVNDQLQQWCGVAELGKWIDRDVIGQQLTLCPVHCVPHYGHCVVAAHADGNFDKRGLPDPLEVLLYFTLAQDTIVQLIVLRDLSGTSPFEASLRH
jgi:hypothetical protein